MSKVLHAPQLPTPRPIDSSRVLRTRTLISPPPSNIFADVFYLKGLFIALVGMAIFLPLLYGPSRVLGSDGEVILPATSFGGPRLSLNPEAQKQAFLSGERPRRVAEFYHGILGSDQTITMLARTHGISLSTMLSVNKIEDLARVRTGFRYVIPGIDGILHKVSRGQSMDKISDFYGVSKVELLEINGLINENLREGQSVFIPQHALSDDEVNRIVGKSFLFPVPGTITRAFGKIQNGLTETMVFNDGIGIETNPDQEVYAAYHGRVVRGGLHSLYGYYVILEHKGRLHTFYGYLAGVELQIGDEVARGDVIGRVGRSGYTNGQSLHFSVLHKSKPVDPLKYLK
ncbi:MAG: peptidoglycan DD-metalloendopeptidase family protein [Spirochaetia bacterium]